MKEKFFINGRIIDPSQNVDEVGGLIVDEKGKINQDATDRLRSKMRQDRGDVELFNFGGTIDEIKARSMEETYLEPPVSP